ncbi:type VI secretion system protein TssA [Gallaecimonas kandeliae]|uniref:type VI secretion system protein TssA n=1 Tax=Gallaecimonas kandeliae TaxID=3029055 RepID=UPI00264A363B|nr:type VI secretion system protein TssA [Gallaecimonas kandeliae]WKE65742.1 type VI secretion system protein TssA [Gallaecimonas kandeliae]
MNSTSLFDIEALLAPVSDENPCGDDTREDVSPESPYFTLKDIRNQARAQERHKLMDDDFQSPEQWRELVRQVPAILQGRSKDLELVAWLIEGLCREYGFAGLAAGFDLAHQLIEQHWDALHPMPDEDGVATRLAALAGLNGLDGDGTLIQPILSVPLFHSGDGEALAAWHCEQAAEIGRLSADKAEQRVKAGAVSNEMLTQAVRETPDGELLGNYRQLQAAIAAYQALAQVLDDRSGEPQPTTRIAKALQRCLDAFNFQGGERLKELLASAAPAQELAQPEDGGEAAAEPGQAPAASDLDPIRVAIQSRDQAVEQLRKLADFFRQTEPHSPVSYAIEQAIRWSRLSLPELMNELIDDNGARQGFCRLTGVPASEAQG